MLGLYLLVNNLLKGKAPPIRIRIFLESHIIIIIISSIITYKWEFMELGNGLLRKLGFESSVWNFWARNDADCAIWNKFYCRLGQPV